MKKHAKFGQAGETEKFVFDFICADCVLQCVLLLNYTMKYGHLKKYDNLFILFKSRQQC